MTHTRKNQQGISNQQYVTWFRNTSPYINAHRHKVFVIALGGEAIQDPNFENIIHDFALLNSLGIKLVIVHGARPQINQALAQRGIEPVFVDGKRITDTTSLDCVLDATGKVRIQIEALLSMGVANSPMHGAQIRVCSGNFVTAKPYGVRAGIDFQHTGAVRKVNRQAIETLLANQNIVLIPHVGYSPTGEVFNLSWEEVAEQTAITLNADKLIFFGSNPGVSINDKLQKELTINQLQQVLADFEPALRRQLTAAINAVMGGVKRCHFISHALDGALLQELFTRDGSGTLLTEEHYEQRRIATIDDVTGILELIGPLEQQGILVRRSRERLETEIGHFSILERDGLIIGCAALYPYPEHATAELACVAVHPDYRNGQRGDRLLEHIEARAKETGTEKLFVLTTHTAHWFRERGFEPGRLEDLPQPRQVLYNLQRNSKVFIKTLPKSEQTTTKIN